MNTKAESTVESDVREWEAKGYVEVIRFHRSASDVSNGYGRVRPKKVDY